jgi:hypothetical protein
VIRRSLPLVALAVAAVAAFSPAVAHAAPDTVLNFDDLPPGTVVDEQYASQGVVFGDRDSFGFPRGSCNPDRPSIIQAPQNFGHGFGGVLQLTKCGGESEFPTWGGMGAFSSFRTRVGVDVAAVNGSPPAIARVKLSVFDVHRNLLASSTVPYTESPQTLVVDVATPEIAFFLVEQIDGGGELPLAIDHLTVDNPPVPPDPEFSIGVDTQGFPFRLRQGGTRQLNVRMLRFNGSNGPISLGVSGLPVGFPFPKVSASFSPNPAGGSSFITNSTLTLTAQDAAALGSSQVTVSGNPAASAGSAPDSATFQLDIVPPFVLTGDQTASVAPCTPSTAAYDLLVDPTFTSPIDLSITSSSPTVQGTIATPFTPGFSNPLGSLTITAPQAAGRGDATLTVTASSGGFTSSFPIAVDRNPGYISNISLVGTRAAATFGFNTAHLNVAPSSVHISGTGFCPGSFIRFGGDSKGALLTSIAPDGTSADAILPFTATSGVPIVINSDSDGITPPFNSYGGPLKVTNYRDTYGFSFQNFTSAGPSWDDVVDLYGHRQTDIQLDPCGAVTFGIVNCSLGPSLVPNPAALLYWHAINDYGEGGNCFGMAFASFRLAQRQKPLSDFSPPGAATVWALDGPNGPSSGLRAYVRLMHLVQSSREGIQEWNKVFGRQDEGTFVQRIAQLLAVGRPAMISIRQGNGGHALLAYAIQPSRVGQYDVEVYDSNAPYTPAEGFAPPSHDAALERSVIHVNNGTWSDPELKWSGDFGQIGAYDPADLAKSLTLPDGIGDFIEMISTPGQLGADQPTSASGAPVPGAVRKPAETGDGPGPMIDLVPRGKGLAARLSGKGGSVAMFERAHGFALDGRASGISLNPAGSLVGAANAASGVRLSTTAPTDGGERVASAAFRTPGADGIALGWGPAGSLVVRSSSTSATVDLTFGQTSRRAVSALAVSGLRLGRGDTATIAPGSWTAPGRVRATIAGRSGRRTVTLRAHRSRAATAVRSVRLTLKSHKGGATATARVRVRAPGGGATSATLAWQAVRGARAVRHGSVALRPDQLNGTVSFPIKLRPGSYAVQVVVIAGGASKGSDVPAVSARKATARVRVR